MAGAQMIASTNLSVILDETFNQKEFEIYSSISSCNVDQKLAVMDFFKELRTAKEQLIRKYAAANDRQRIHCAMGEMRSLAVKKVLYWMQTIHRRMRKTSRQKCSYRIDICLRMSEEIFSYVKDLLTCVSEYGLEVHNKKEET